MCNDFRENDLQLRAFVKRRGQDSLKACPLLFAVCRKLLVQNNFGIRRVNSHVTLIAPKDNIARYKNATNFRDYFECVPATLFGFLLLLVTISSIDHVVILLVEQGVEVAVLYDAT